MPKIGVSISHNNSNYDNNTNKSDDDYNTSQIFYNNDTDNIESE